MRFRTSAPALLCCVLLLPALLAGPALAQPTPAPSSGTEPSVTAAAAILVDARTGHVLFGKDVHAVRAPASMTKVVTALVVRDLYRLDEIVTVSDAVDTVRGERLGLRAGMPLSVRDLLYAMLLLSGNDTATALAAHHPAGYDAFIAAMNEKAAQLGALDSRFANPHGLDAPGHVSSAWDMAIFGRRLLQDELLADIVSTKLYPVPWPDERGSSRVVQNHNKLLWRYPGTIGMKTGFTNQAGRCLLAAVRDGPSTAITVVMRSVDHYADTTVLFDHFKTRPSPGALGTLPATVRQAAAGAAAVAAEPVLDPAGGPAGPARYRWIVLPMAVLSLCTLLTLRRPRRREPLHEAAQFHHYLEPLTVRVTPAALPDEA